MSITYFPAAPSPDHNLISEKGEPLRITTIDGFDIIFQSGTNSFLFRNSSGATRWEINNSNISPGPDGALDLGTLTKKLANVFASASIQIRDGSGALVSLRDTGLNYEHSDLEQNTVGGAGGADALPANPSKYIQVVDSTGTTHVIPLYAAS